MTRYLVAGALALGIAVPATPASAVPCGVVLSCCAPPEIEECRDYCKVFLRVGPVVFCADQHLR